MLNLCYWLSIFATFLSVQVSPRWRPPLLVWRQISFCFKFIIFARYPSKIFITLFPIYECKYLSVDYWRMPSLSIYRRCYFFWKRCTHSWIIFSYFKSHSHSFCQTQRETTFFFSSIFQIKSDCMYRTAALLPLFLSVTCIT